MPISSRHRRIEALTAVVVALTGTASAGAATPAPPVAASAPTAAPTSPTPAVQEMLLAVIVNGQAMSVTPVLREPNGRILVLASDLLRWRFVHPDAAPAKREDGSHLALDALPGVRHRLDAATQTLHIDSTADNFLATVLSQGARYAGEPPAAPFGGYINYDVSVQAAEHRTSVGGLFEAVAFGRWGSLANGVLAHNASGGSGGGAVVRLDTTWILDRHADMATWRAGDAVSRAGSWSQPMRLAGLQYATNFGTQPGFVTFPMPSLGGVAALPSTVDLYINDALRMRRDVPAGPFSIPELPVVTGMGEARIVVHDILGRQQTIVAPFFASAQLLRPGLRDFSYELGALRANFGRDSADYGKLVAVGTERRGLSDTLTGEVHAEVARDRQALGVGSVWLWPAAGVFSAALAASHDDSGSGALLSLGFQRQSARLSFGSSWLASTAGFVPLGLPSEPPAPRRRAQAYASYSTEQYGAFALTYVQQSLRDRPNVRLAGASYALALGSFGQFSLALLRDVRGGRTSASLNFSRSFGADTSFSAGASTQGASRSAQVQVQRNLPAGSGVGYRLMAAHANSSRAEANLLLQDDHGSYTLDATVDAGRPAVRAGAAGGIAMIGAQLFASRVIRESFSIVELPGFADVRIYAANQLVARTGTDGTALVPRLLPYQRNAIRIEQADLPLDATVDALGVSVVPRFRSGVLVRIPIRRSRGGSITVLLDDGLPLPAGASAAVADSAELFPTAQDGEIYLTGLADKNTVTVTWRDQRCEFGVPFPPTADPLPQLGTFVCSGVKR